MSRESFFGGGRPAGRRLALGLAVALLAVGSLPPVVSAGAQSIAIGRDAPVAPSGVSASSTDESVTVSWVVPAQPWVNLDEMFLERVTDDGNGSDVVAWSKGVADDWDLSAESSWTYAVVGLDADTEYRFRVRLATRDHSDLFSETVTVSTQSEPPAAPRGLSASADEDGQVRLSWTVPTQPDWVNDLERMVVDRRDTGGEAHFSRVAEVDWEQGTTSYSAVDQSPRRGLPYWYRVKMVVGGRFVVSDTVQVTVPAQVTSGAGPLAGFSLIDATTQLLRAVVDDGDTVDLAGAGSGDFTVRADIVEGQTVGSVYLELAGPVSWTRTESYLPYALYGDNGVDDLYGGGPLPVGDYTLTATAYSMRWRRGDTLGTLTAAFSIADSDPPSSAPQLDDAAGPLAGFSLIDASDQTVIAELPAEGGSVSLDDPDGGSYALRADIAEGESVGSVSLTLSGAASYGPRTENLAPYSLHGHNQNSLAPHLWGRPLPAGDYTLTATAYHGRNLSGARTGTLEAAFTVTDGGESGYPDFSLSAFNRDPQGMWSDGTTMWVVEWNTHWVYAYSLADGARDTDSDIRLDSGHTAPSGIWSDGTTVWVGDTQDHKLYAYALADGSRDSGNDRSLATGLRPDGFWSNGTTMWIVDTLDLDTEVHAYSMSDWSRDSANDFALFSDHLLAVHGDLWSDGSTVWVSEWTEGKLHAYTLSDLTRHPGLTVDTSEELGIDDPGGVWSNGAKMWVLDHENRRVRVFDKPAIGQPGRPASGPLAGFSLVNASNQRLMAELTDGASVSVGDPDGGSYAIRADIVEGGIVGSMSLELSGAKNVPARTDTSSPYSLYGDRKNRWFRDLKGESLPVGDYTLTATVYSRTRLRGIVHGTLEVSFSVTLNEEGDVYGDDPPATYSGFELMNFNRNPSGIWSDGTTMWVLDIYDDYVYAYSLADGARAHKWDLNLHSGHTSPRGIWSDGTTMWVGDSDDEKLYAYALADGSRDTDNDRSLSAGLKPDGLWSNGITMWIVDGTDERAYAYQMSGWLRDSAKDIELIGEHLLAQHNDLWSDGTNLWVAEWAEGKLYAYKLANQSRNSRLDIDASAELGIDDPNGVWSNGTTMWILDGDDEEIHVIGRDTPSG